eukprot:5450091-Pyramimonas_sp.AAC.1
MKEKRQSIKQDKEHKAKEHKVGKKKEKKDKKEKEKQDKDVSERICQKDTHKLADENATYMITQSINLRPGGDAPIMRHPDWDFCNVLSFKGPVILQPTKSDSKTRKKRKERDHNGDTKREGDVENKALPKVGGGKVEAPLLSKKKRKKASSTEGDPPSVEVGTTDSNLPAEGSHYVSLADRLNPSRQAPISSDYRNLSFVSLNLLSLSQGSDIFG